MYILSYKQKFVLTCIFHPIRVIRAYKRLERAISQADESHAKSGDRFYVLPMDTGGLLVTNKYSFKRARKSGRIYDSGYISQHPTIRDLVRECFYHTPYSNGSSPISPALAKAKRHQFYSWYLNF